MTPPVAILGNIEGKRVIYAVESGQMVGLLDQMLKKEGETEEKEQLYIREACHVRPVAQLGKMDSIA